MSRLLHLCTPQEKLRVTIGKTSREKMRSCILPELLPPAKRCCLCNGNGAVSLSAHYLHSKPNALCFPFNTEHKWPLITILAFSLCQTVTIGRKLLVFILFSTLGENTMMLN